MMKVKIAKLKTELSNYLKKVRNGAEVIVTDRDTPIAKIIPYKSLSEKLLVLPSLKSPKEISKLKIPPALEKTDSLKVLLEDRSKS